MGRPEPDQATPSRAMGARSRGGLARPGGHATLSRGPDSIRRGIEAGFDPEGRPSPGRPLADCWAG